MAAWSKNNLSQRNTWSTLLILDQSDSTFANSEKKKVKQFRFWSNADSAAVRKTKAQSLAAQMDNVFRLMWGADYEKNVTRTRAIKSLAGVLQSGDKTMFDLAEAADDSYLFAGEQANG